MGSQSLNLALRFLLELSMLAAVGYWSWQQHEGLLGIMLAIGLPLLMAVIWVLFNVPDDPSRSGKAPVVVPGIVRLLIELCLFGTGIWAIIDLGYTTTGLTFSVVVLAHYAISYDRIIWLLRK